MNPQHITVSSLQFRTVSIRQYGFFLTLPENREDFWLYLGGILGWGLFVNSDKLRGDTSEWRRDGISFTLVSIQSASGAFPAPRTVLRFQPAPPRKFFEMPVEIISPSDRGTQDDKRAPQAVVSTLLINAVAISPDGPFLVLPEDREDFWLNLGGILGWGFFVNSDKLRCDTSEWRQDGVPFTLVSIKPANAEFPPQQSVSRLQPVRPKEFCEVPLEIHSYLLPKDRSGTQEGAENPWFQETGL